MSQKMLDNLQEKQNNFGLIRLTLAIIVFVTHFLMLNGKANWVTLGSGSSKTDFGTIAVAGFFGVSGYLLTPSALRHSPKQYFTRRFLRIFPGYWLLLLFTSIIIMFAIGFQNRQNSNNDKYDNVLAMIYLTKNLCLIQFEKYIVGLFSPNSLPDLVNGSLWSLFPEFICYTILYIGIKFCASINLSNIKVSISLLISSFILGVLLRIDGSAQLVESLFPGKTREFLSMLNVFQAFLVGICTYLVKKKFCLFLEKRTQLIAFFFLFIILVGLDSFYLIGSIFFTLLVISLGLRNSQNPISRFCIRTDLSYGIYLYHVPIVQLTLLVSNLMPWPNFLLGIFTFSAIIVLLFSVFSWFLVEKPLIGLAQRKGE
jgi:peptidoglycan/LPS O-acetylase OafA/YrhL